METIKKIQGIIFLTILILNGIMAMEVYSGEQVIIQLDKEYVYYSVVGNSSPVNLELIKSGNDVIIKFDKYSIYDNFEIIFFDNNQQPSRSNVK